MKLPDYKGFGVEIDDNGTFSARMAGEDESAASAKTLSELKTKVDKISKAKFNTPVIIDLHQHGIDVHFADGHVTSMCAEKNYAQQTLFRVTYKDTDRFGHSWKDCSINELIKTTEQNQLTIKKIKVLREEMRNTEREIIKLKKSMERYAERELQ